jgi:hypothetical protein
MTGSRSTIGFLSIHWALKVWSSGTPGSHYKSTAFGEDEVFATHTHFLARGTYDETFLRFLKESLLGGRICPGSGMRPSNAAFQTEQKTNRML